jgi:hypothetical protein
MLSTISDALDWQRIDNQVGHGRRSRVFARALGATEKGYYWDRCAPDCAAYLRIT